jgi:two-component system, NarL family, sensor histidine kinase UhpB
MRSRTLLSQVLAVNAVLVGITTAVAAIVARNRLSDATSSEGLLLLALAIASAILLNSILLRQRLRHLDHLVETMDAVDLSRPGTRAAVRRHAPREVERLTAGFNRMLRRLEDERRAAGRAVFRAQEEERQRIAQDLHDEVNQALTAILLRLSATMSDAPSRMAAELAETRELVQQAMEELLQLSRQLRPTALDDHGLISALASQVRDFQERTKIEAAFKRHGDVPALSSEEQLVLYRVTQEGLSNVAQHSGARGVRVELNFVGRTVLKITDDGHGFDPRHAMSNGGARANGNGRTAYKHRPGGLGVSGMRERALLVGGVLDIYSKPGEGTTVELTMGSR